MKINKKTLLNGGKQVLQVLVMMLVVAFAVDWWRKPTMPTDAAHMPLTTMQQAQPQTLAQMSAQEPLVLYFWESWCGVCRHTSPVMQRLQQNGVPVLGVVSHHSGSLNDVRDYVQRHGWAFDNVHDESGELINAWDVKAVPTIVVIKEGRVVHSTTGLTTYWGLRARLWWAKIYS